MSSTKRARRFQERHKADKACIKIEADDESTSSTLGDSTSLSTADVRTVPMDLLSEDVKNKSKTSNLKWTHYIPQMYKAADDLDSPQPTEDMTSPNHTNRELFLRLIAAVKKRPCLWDPNADNFGGKKSKNYLWIEIGKEVGFSRPLDAKTGWKRLRDQHRDSVKRRTRKLMQPWRFSKEMEFLLPVMKKRKLQKGDEVYRICTTADGLTPNKRRATDETSESGSETLEELDHLNSFFEAMQTTTRKLPGLLQLEIKRKIFEVVSNAEEKYLKSLETENDIDKSVSPPVSPVMIEIEQENKIKIEHSNDDEIDDDGYIIS